MTIAFSYPRQSFESFVKEHVCYDCVKSIQYAVQNVLDSKKPVN